MLLPTEKILSSMDRLKKSPLVWVGAGLSLLGALLFVVWPVAKVLSYPKLQDFASFFTTHMWYTAMLHSLFLTALSTVTGTLAAFLFAYTIVRLEVPLKKIFHFVTLLPVLSPPFIVALSYIFLFGGQGLITKDIFHLQVNIYGWQGLWLVQTVTFFPYAFTAIHAVLSSLSAHLEYAAANLGASRWRTFRDVVFPLCRPGIAGGALMLAVDVLTDFGNPEMLGGNYTVLPTEAYMQIVGWNNLPTASMLATMLLLPALVLFFINKYWVSRRSYVTVTGKESGLRALPPHPLVKWGIFAFCVLFSALVLSIYGVLIYGAFATLWGYNWAPSLKNFAYVLFAGNQVLNSLIYALASAFLASAAGMLAASLAHKEQNALGRVLDFFAISPGAVPGVFLGLGYLLAFNDRPLMLNGTAAILIIALTVWNIPNCYTVSLAALQQIGSSIDEASLNLGGSGFQTFLHITLPLLRVPFLSGFRVAFLRSVTCLSVIIFLYSTDTIVGTISILNFVQDGEWGRAAALTALLIAAAMVVMGILQLLLRGQKGIKSEDRS